MKRYSWIAALLVVALAFVLFGCGGEAPYFEKPAFEQNVLVITSIADWGPGIDLLHEEFKFKENFLIEVSGVCITDTQILFNDNKSGWAPLKNEDGDDGNGGTGGWNPVLTAGDEFETTIVMDLTTFTPTANNAPEGVRFKLNGAPGGSVAIIDLIVYNNKGKELFNLAELIAELEPGELDEEAFKEISKMIQPAGAVGEHIKIEILGP